MPLLTLDEAKSILALPAGTQYDDELTVYIEALTEVIEGFVGPIEAREVVEQADARGQTLALLQVPALSLTSFSPVLSGGSAVDVAGLHLDGASGAVGRLDGAAWTGGPWTVTYQAGRTTVPASLTVAARLLLQHWWRTRYGAARGNPGGGEDYDVNEPVPGYGYAIPNRVLQLLEPYRRPPVVA
ncbi:hypothetical protein GCM10010275_29970 [Streptomyces litmocidini]|uniref:hypothetical protein n=1 Tax=Streptomyces litmocidini TaxID=67318 RepID=UPI00167D5B27|nr:hypothetical protein [Streptomyces litmocidini]GGU90971.1 hypothetical protein GCM10010275_29970 [Streptomyces litmocidini]